MRKFFCKFLIITLLCLSVFTGCALTEVNTARYFKLPIAKATTSEETYTLNMEEFILAFNNYSDNYLQQMSAKEAFDTVIKEAVQKKMIIDHVNKTYWTSENSASWGKYEWRALENTYASINYQVYLHEEELRKERGLPSVEFEDSSNANSETDSSKDTTYINSPYESAFEVVEDHLQFKELSTEPIAGKTFPNARPAEVNLISEFVFSSPGAPQNLNAEPQYKEIFNEAKDNYIEELKDSYKNKGIKNKTADEVFVLEIERIYAMQLDAEKLDYMQYEIFEKQMQRTDAHLLTIKTDIFNYYVSAIEREKRNFQTSNQDILKNNIADYLRKMADSSQEDLALYHPTSPASFFYVSHILLKFDETVENTIKKMEEGIPVGKFTKEQLNNYISNQYQYITVQPRNSDGVVDTTATPLSPNAVLAEVNKFVNYPAAQRVEEFRKLMFAYNGDGGIMGKTTGYAIPTNSYKNYLKDNGLQKSEDETLDTMVPEFADFAREIYNDGDVEMGYFNKDGGNAKLIPSKFGYHIIMYLGEPQNFITDFNDVDTVVNLLAQMPLRADYNKTYLDYIYEQLGYDANGGYTRFIEGMLPAFDIKIYEKNYQNELKKFK